MRYQEGKKVRIVNLEDFLWNANIVHGDRYDYSCTEYLGSNVHVKIRCKKHGEFIQSSGHHISHGQGCPKCVGQTSKQELEYLTFLKELLPNSEVIGSDRKTLKGKELDIFVPEFNLAIEYNGVYWHSSNSTENDEKYAQKHIFKTDRCQELGIDLLHINEFDNVDIWKNIIREKLDMNTKIDVRDCVLQYVNCTEARSFLTENDLRGDAYGSFRLGWFYEGRLVQLVVIDDSSDTEMVRFCTVMGLSIVNGLSEMMRIFRETNPDTVLTVHANRRWGYLNLLEAAGFAYIGSSRPDYKYFKGKFIVEKDGITDPSDMYSKGYRRIWNSGKIILELR